MVPLGLDNARFCAMLEIRPKPFERAGSISANPSTWQISVKKYFSIIAAAPRFAKAFLRLGVISKR
jgi:hypothetical protein